MKKVLFISHDASRTGAPIVLLHFLKWFKANYDIPFQILLRKGGELKSEFTEVAPVTIFHKQETTKKRLVTRILNRFGLYRAKKKRHLNSIKQQLKKDDIGLIYANTVVNGEILEFLADLDCPVICHVHELEMIIKHYAGLADFAKVKRHSSNYIAVSQAVKDNLIKNHSILKEKINIVHEFIPTQDSSLNNYQETKEFIFQELGIVPDAKIVCGSGSTDHWRKGTDLFVQLAYAVSKKHTEPTHFVWVGGKIEGLEFDKLLYDVKNAGLENYIHFLGTKSNPLDYFAACDVFTLVSREDPFPLVCLEAASLGKPIVCFDNAGGEKEFVEDDCGFVVPYLDIETMANKVIHLLNSVELNQRFGQRAKEKVKQRHDISIAGTEITKIIKQFLPEYST